MIAKIYTVGTTVRITTETRDSSNVLTDVSSIVITITDPADEVKITEQVMSKANTGSYYYNWQSDTDDDTGQYKATVKATAADGKISIKSILLFELRDIVDA